MSGKQSPEKKAQEMAEAEIQPWLAACKQYAPPSISHYHQSLLEAYRRWQTARLQIPTFPLTGFETFLGPEPEPEQLRNFLASLNQRLMSMVGHSRIIPGFTPQQKIYRALAILQGEAPTNLLELEELQVVLQALLAYARAIRSSSPTALSFHDDLAREAARVELVGTPLIMRPKIVPSLGISMPIREKDLAELPFLRLIGKVGTPPVRHALAIFRTRVESR